MKAYTSLELTLGTRPLLTIETSGSNRDTKDIPELAQPFRPRLPCDDMVEGRGRTRFSRTPTLLEKEWAVGQ